MEGIFDFDSKYTESRFPTALQLKKIKQMLLSGDKNQILQSVERIKAFIYCEESLSEVIRSDISEFLCDAVVPFDPDIVSALYNCLELMSRHVEFFTHNHSCFAVESLMRTLHFTMKDSSNFICLNQCLNLLKHIVKGYNNFEVTPEKKTIENLLHLLPILVKNMTPTINNKYHIGTFLLTLLELNALKQSQEAQDIILVNFNSWFNLLNEILESEHPMREKLIQLCCQLSHYTLRYLVMNNNTPEEDPRYEIDENLKDDIIMNITEFLISIGAPYVDSLPLSSVEDDSTHVENFYQAVLYFFSDDIASGKTRLAHGLGEMGFLHFTTRIISHADSNHCQKLRRLCLLILFHMILYLSEDVFHFPEVWPNGRDDFRSEIQHGVAQLPVEPSQWLEVLVDPQAASCSKLAVLLYLYFYTMTAKSQDMLRVVYPSVASFIHGAEGIESSVLLMKLVWFIFVMSQLSTASPENELDATDRMVSLLEIQNDLSLIYTHHPALLYWAFSSRVSSTVQTQTVHLWLRHKTPDCKELDELMEKSSDVRLAVLEIIKSGSGEELYSAFSALKSLLPDSDDLAASIWFLLPQVLAKFTADSTSAANVDYLIELCSMKTPEALDMGGVLRIAFLLPEVFCQSDLLSTVPSLSLTQQLLQVGAQKEDNRVLHMFLRHDGFVLKVLEGLNSNVSDISLLCLKIISVMWKECLELRNMEKRKKIKITRETILRIFETNCNQVLSAGLDLLQQVLLTGFRSPVFEVQDADANVAEVLFLQVQNICVKSSPNISGSCWQCLKLFLTAGPSGADAPQDEFVTHPLLHDLILSNLARLKESPEFREFLAAWLDLNNSKLSDPWLDRKLFGAFYAATLRRLDRMVTEDEVLVEKIAAGMSSGGGGGYCLGRFSL